MIVSRESAERFLFAPVDSRSAAFFRVALAAMLVVVFWPRARPLAPLIEEVPGELYARVFLTAPYRWLTVAGSALLAAGWRPRVVGPLLAALLAPLFLRYGDIAQQLLLVALVSFSLLQSDAYRLGRTSAGPMWPIRLVQFQLSVVYGINAIAKTTPAYLSGEVLVGMSRMLPNFLLDLSDGYVHVVALAIPVGVAAVASALTEYALAVGFWWPPARAATAALGVTFHLILKMILRIGLLDWACMFLYLAFLIPFERDAVHDARRA